MIIAMKYLLFAVSTTGCAAMDTKTINTGHLLRQMTDMTRLAEFPAPPYKTVQFSSYDRASRLAGGPGWFANSDGFGGETVPNFEAVLTEPDENGVGEYLVCDVEGPGAVVRTWTAGINGDIRVHLDGAEQPLYDGPAAEFLACPYQSLAEESAIDPALFENTFQQMQAAYCPIPFAKRCRMVWRGEVKKLHFYHVQIRQYQPGVAVTTFTPQDLKTFAKDVQDAARILADPARELKPGSTKPAVPIQASLAPGEKQEVLKLDGPQALEGLTLKVDAHDTSLALRQTVLHVVCDEYPWGQVQAPIGDFFGAAPGINPYNELPFTVTLDGTMTCRYVMPFESSIRIVLDNRGRQPVTVSGSALPMDYRWNDRSMHLRARWRVNHDVFASPRAVQDMPFLLAHGSGRLVGTALMLMNPCRIPTPWGGWWGEGDEKIFVDDETFPSTFGTGSEDYFNYAWSVPDIFTYAYCGQPRNDGPGNRGFVTNQRWHILDDLPFRNRLAFYIELYPHDDVPGMSYARIAYHYARPGLMDDHVAITDDDVRHLQLPPDWQPGPGFGMHNAVYHHAEDLVPPGPRVTLQKDNLWAGGQLLAWQPAGPDDRLDLRFPIAEDGKFCLHLGLALNAEAGTISAQLDGKPVTLGGRETIDLYDAHRVRARQFGTETIELKKGEHVMTVVWHRAPEAVKKPIVGIDYLGVQQR